MGVSRGCFSMSEPVCGYLKTFWPPCVKSYQHQSVLHVCLCVLHTVAVSQLPVVTGTLTVLFVLPI